MTPITATAAHLTPAGGRSSDADFTQSIKLIVYEETRTRLMSERVSIGLDFCGMRSFMSVGDPMSVERRSVGRTTISKTALLFFDAQRGVFTCGVHDITNRGAGIRLQELHVLPANFELTFDNFHTVHKCRVVWRQGDFVGVAFQN